MPLSRTSESGWTLIELLAVMVIIAVLIGALLGTGVIGAFGAASETQTAHIQSEIEMLLGEIERDLGSYPSGEWEKFRGFVNAHPNRFRGLDPKVLQGGTETNSGSEILYALFEAWGKTPSVDKGFIQDTDEDGFPEYTDAWQNPLVYICNLTDDRGQKTLLRSVEGDGYEEAFVRPLPKKGDGRRAQGSWQLISAGRNELFDGDSEDSDDVVRFGKD